MTETEVVLRLQCNAILHALLGSEDLVERWWKSPNRNWNLRTPEEVFENDPSDVHHYLLSHAI